MPQPDYYGLERGYTFEHPEYGKVEVIDEEWPVALQEVSDAEEPELYEIFEFEAEELFEDA